MRRRGPLLQLLPWWTAAAAFAAVAVRLPETRAVALPSVDVEPREVALLEKRWIDEAFPLTWLPAPALQPPCPTGLRAASPWSLRIADALTDASQGRVDDAVDALREMERWDPLNWVPSLSHGVILLRAQRLDEAVSVLERASRQSIVSSRVRSARSAVERRRPSRGPTDEDVLGIVHLLHAHGAAALAAGRVGENVAEDLFDAVDCARLLAMRADRDAVLPRGDEGPSGWIRWPLRAPGCQRSDGDLTTLDLHNNLLLVLLATEDWSLDAKTVDEDVHRGYNDPAHENPLLHLLRALSEIAGRAAGAEKTVDGWTVDTSVLLAVSHAERLLRGWTPAAGGNVRLALNLATLLDALAEAVPEEARAHLRQRVGDELAFVLEKPGAVPLRQQPERGRAVVRLLLRRAVTAGEAPRVTGDLDVHLDAAQRARVDLVARSIGLRSEEGWAERPVERSAALNDLMPGAADAWRQAAALDLAAALARHGLEVPAGDERLLLEDRMPAALLAAAGAWILGWWLALQLANLRDLRTSFYRREALRRLGGR